MSWLRTFGELITAYADHRETEKRTEWMHRLAERSEYEERHFATCAACKKKSNIAVVESKEGSESDKWYIGYTCACGHTGRVSQFGFKSRDDASIRLNNGAYTTVEDWQEEMRAGFEYEAPDEDDY